MQHEQLKRKNVRDSQRTQTCPAHVAEVFQRKLRKTCVHDFGENIANTAFSFGLACGTASCLEKENSVFVTSDALKLFEQMERPRLCK